MVICFFHNNYRVDVVNRHNLPSLAFNSVLIQNQHFEIFMLRNVCHDKNKLIKNCLITVGIKIN